MNKEFRTVIQPLSSPFLLNRRDGIVMVGSCFSENIGAWLSKYRCDLLLNSHGILFNPVSIASSLEDLLMLRQYTTADLVQNNGLWHSFSHHGRFSATDAEQVVADINSSVVHAHAKLKSARLLVITWGSAWAYRLKSDGRIVANCHRFPHQLFEKILLKQDVLHQIWSDLLIKLRDFNPDLRVVFTISPVRHLRDGFHQNQLSKSTLLLAAEDLVTEHPHAVYFPAYEIMMDDLRDYRFYAADMIHPNETAIDYIRTKFCQWIFDEQSNLLFREMEPLISFLEHRPMKISEAEHDRLRAEKESLLLKMLSK